MGATSHKHDLAETKSDCAAGHFARHQPAGLPHVAAEAVPASVLFSYWLIGFVTDLIMAQPSYPIPLAQAPPHRLPMF